MPDEEPTVLALSQLREKALSRWENEGGAVVGTQGVRVILDVETTDVPALTNAELSQLHIRVIALEGLVTTLLAEASDRQVQLAREMAAYISPRPGFTQHTLTIRAATQMIDLLERAGHFRSSAADANAIDRPPMAVDPVLKSK